MTNSGVYRKWTPQLPTKLHMRDLNPLEEVPPLVKTVRESFSPKRGIDNAVLVELARRIPCPSEVELKFIATYLQLEPEEISLLRSQYLHSIFQSGRSVQDVSDLIVSSRAQELQVVSGMELVLSPRLSRVSEDRPPVDFKRRRLVVERRHGETWVVSSHASLQEFARSSLVHQREFWRLVGNFAGGEVFSIVNVNPPYLKLVVR